QGRDGHRRILTAGVFHDGWTAAAGAAELHFRVRAHIGVVEHVLCAATGTTGGHGSKVTAGGGGGGSGGGEGGRQGDAGARAEASEVEERCRGRGPAGRGRGYGVLCLDDVGQQSRALEELRQACAGGDEAQASTAQSELGVVDARAGTGEGAVKVCRPFA